MPTNRPGKSAFWFGKYLSLALALPGYVLAGVIMGVLADRWIHWPILRAIGVILGTLAGLLQIFRELRRDEEREKRESRPE